MNARAARVRAVLSRRRRPAGTDSAVDQLAGLADAATEAGWPVPPVLELSRDEIMVLLGALHADLARIRSTRRDSPDVVHSAETTIGRLIWRLEEIDAWPLTPGHSADAVQP